MWIRPNKYCIRTGNTLRKYPFYWKKTFDYYNNKGSKYDVDYVVFPLFSYNKNRNWEIKRFIRVTDIKTSKTLNNIWIKDVVSCGLYPHIVKNKMNRFSNRIIKMENTNTLKHEKINTNFQGVSTHDVILRYDNYRLGRSVPNRERWGWYTYHVRRSKFLTGYNNYTNDYVKIGKYVKEEEKYGSMGIIKRFIDRKTDGYPIFINVYNGKYRFKENKRRTIRRIDRNDKIKKIVSRRNMLKENVRKEIKSYYSD